MALSMAFLQKHLFWTFYFYECTVLFDVFVAFTINLTKCSFIVEKVLWIIKCSSNQDIMVILRTVY